MRAALFLERISVRIGVAVAWLGIPLMILTAAIVPLARWLGWSGDAPFSEASTVAFLAATMTSFGYAYAAGAHVRVDVLSRRFPPRVNAAIELAGTLLILVPLCAVLHETGLAANLLAGFARAFGRMRGGPALATIAVGAIQAPAAGMIGASTGALALYALPALKRHGYRSADAAGLVAAVGSLGAVAPPGIMLFFIADAIGVQVPALFLAMLGPLALLLVLYLVYAISRGSPVRVELEHASNVVGALLTAALMIGLVALVGLGLATLSEAAALAAAGAVLAGAAHARLTWRVLDSAIRQTALLSAMVFFIFVGASVFSLVFRLLGGAEMVSAGAGALGTGGYAPLAGCWIGALFAIVLQTSFLTPPFGYALFLVYGATRGEVPMAEVWRGAIPYVGLQLLALLAVAALPEFATWLPAQVLDLSIPKGPKFSD